jgi:hypothetical protein
MSAMSATAAVAPNVQVRSIFPPHLSGRRPGNPKYESGFNISYAIVRIAEGAARHACVEVPHLRRSVSADTHLLPTSSVLSLFLTSSQVRLGARAGKAVKARRSAVVLRAVSEPEPTTEEPAAEPSASPAASADADAPKKDKPAFKPKRKFVKKTVTVQDADISIGNEYTGKVVRAFTRRRRRRATRTAPRFQSVPSSFFSFRGF